MSVIAVLSLPCGLAIGLLLGALGGGGSILAVPALVYLLHQSPHAATAGALVVVAIGAATGLACHARAGRVRWAAGLAFGALGTAGTWIGSRWSASLDPAVLMTAFAGLMLVVAATMLVRTWRDRRGNGQRNGMGAEGKDHGLTARQEAVSGEGSTDSTPPSEPPSAPALPPEPAPAPAPTPVTRPDAAIPPARRSSPSPSSPSPSSSRPSPPPSAHGHDAPVPAHPAAHATAHAAATAHPAAGAHSEADAHGDIGRRATAGARVAGTATVVGLLTGFFGVGGGFVVVPALTLVLGLEMPVAIGTSLLVILVNSATAFATRAGAGGLDWPLLAVFSSCAALGSYLGNRLTARLRPRSLSTAFASLVTALAVAMAASSIPHLL
ncbi:sulfite exporter TauE/SafE family protein [Streptomyces sp. MST-110588]|uniref:sulfite exporter TauE/SafE family protein n=1 Tax=Streptomyces sp. MST-110588 TaxID=2833628 RepID=UPI002058AAF9|nr:sulfite exporter TauE/SafE family protein [Streptomyces sp. MST-110588]UNO41516.1 sulfite exporter TauE/SafE family protein [Streptomyces sp. MST-110588]